eukprot:3011558-Rhodomonas_salina.3
MVPDARWSMSVQDLCFAIPTEQLKVMTGKEHDLTTSFESAQRCDDWSRVPSLTRSGWRSIQCERRRGGESWEKKLMAKKKLFGIPRLNAAPSLVQNLIFNTDCAAGTIAVAWWYAARRRRKHVQRVTRSGWG